MKHLVFTIACANYMAKARVLAASVKRNMPEVHCILVLLERDGAQLPDKGRFDDLVLAKNVGIPEFEHFLFRHFAMEASTAIKATCFQYFLATGEYRQVIYLDPDIEVFSPFYELFTLNDQSSVIVTPHMLAPEEEFEAFEGVMLSRLKYGLFNLGFIAVNRCMEADRFLTWWEKRLFTACYFNHSEGQFFDQRWIDLAITLFDLKILRHPGYNVAYWNISGRKVEQDCNGTYMVNSVPLRFFHFSGTDKKYDMQQLLKHTSISCGLPLRLREAYTRAIDAEGHALIRTESWSYDTYASGAPVGAAARLAFRKNKWLRSKVPNPYATSDSEIQRLHEQSCYSKT